MAVTVLIQADLLVYQAATATPVGSITTSKGTGGLLQSPVPAHGYVYCTTSSTVSTGTTTIGSTAFLLVASGIKILNWRG